MRVFLCEPNIPVRASRFEPLGLCSISAYLKSKGQNVAVYQQFDQPESKVVEEILSFDPDVVGFSCIDVNMPGALRMAHMVKERKPDAFVVFGGEHPTANWQMVEQPEIDLVVIGEGEITLAEVLDAMESGSRDFSNIAGLALLDGEKAVRTKERDRIADLGSLPLPDREVLGKTRYLYYGLTPSDIGIPAGRLHVASVYLSRGCTFNCRFCTTPNVWGRRWIARPVDGVISEIEKLADKGINFVYFQDENFLTDLKIVREFCIKKIERGLNMPFSIISRIAHLDDETIDLLHMAGLRHIGVGIESVREETLNEINKGLDLAQTKKRIARLRKSGISVCGLFMIGYPWETEEMIREYSPLIRDLGVDSIKIQFLTPFAGTQMYEEAMRDGHILTENPLDHSTEVPVLKSEHLTAEQLIRLRNLLYRRFYFSPAFILKLAKKALRRPSLVPDYFSRLYWFIRRMKRVEIL